jgi:hypothetical protein
MSADRWIKIALSGHMAWLLVILYIMLSIPVAKSVGFEVINASTRLEDGIYHLNAHVSYNFSKPALDALENGVPLTVELAMEVRRKRHWFWNQKVYTIRQRFRLEYHAISRQYLVNNLNSGERRSFPRMQTALDFIEKINDFPLIEQSLLSKNEMYQGALRIVLDTELLPAPLHLFTYLSNDWQLNSQWYIWPL